MLGFLRSKHAAVPGSHALCNSVSERLGGGHASEELGRRMRSLLSLTTLWNESMYQGGV